MHLITHHAINIFILCLLTTLIISTKVINSSKSNNYALNNKSMHFSLYMQDYFNKTDFMILNGIAGPSLTSTTAPFGSAFVIKDRHTTTSSPTSNQLGTIEMVFFTYEPKGINGFMTTKITLDLKNGHHGSISLVGVIPYDRAGDCPVVGGTKDFLFVQGYVTTSFVYGKGAYGLFKFDFHLFWPPYAHQK